MSSIDNFSLDGVITQLAGFLLSILGKCLDHNLLLIEGGIVMVVFGGEFGENFTFIIQNVEVTLVELLIGHIAVLFFIFISSNVQVVKEVSSKSLESKVGSVPFG